MINNAISELTWDSEFFLKKIATVTDLAKLTPSELQNYDLVVNKISSDDYQTLDFFSKLGFTLAEGELEFSKVISEDITENTSIKSSRIYSADVSNIDELINIAKTSFSSSRFRAPWFTCQQREDFYALWVKKAVLGQFDDICLMYQEQNTIHGFISLRKIEQQLKIGLIAVSSSSQGKGVASKLLSSAEIYAKAHQCRIISVATQMSNIPAINLYTGKNYKLKQSSYWLYKEK